jgi:hypothetical protein
MVEGSWVGLDVHARSVIAGVLDARSKSRWRRMWVKLAAISSASCVRSRSVFRLLNARWSNSDDEA